jgi:hypothetical protein
VPGAGPARAGGRVAAGMGRSRACAPDDRRVCALAEYLMMCEREGVDPLIARSIEDPRLARVDAHCRSPHSRVLQPQNAAARTWRLDDRAVRSSPRRPAAAGCSVEQRPRRPRAPKNAPWPAPPRSPPPQAATNPPTRSWPSSTTSHNLLLSSGRFTPQTGTASDHDAVMPTKHLAARRNHQAKRSRSRR